MTYVVLAQQDASSPVPSLIFLGLMIAVFWLFIIRPQRQRAKKQREVADSLMTGQSVKTIGGIYGTVVSVDDESVILEVEDGRIRVSRRAIGARVGGNDS